jgi:hypothetical protein
MFGSDGWTRHLPSSQENIWREAVVREKGKCEGLQVSPAFLKPLICLRVGVAGNKRTDQWSGPSCAPLQRPRGLVVSTQHCLDWGRLTSQGSRALGRTGTQEGTISSFLYELPNCICSMLQVQNQKPRHT